jgi:hypothetical protein
MYVAIAFVPSIRPASGYHPFVHLPLRPVLL